MAQVNENILYQPDERPSHPVSLVHGFQFVMTRMAAMAATASIIAVAGGQSQGYLSWISFRLLRHYASSVRHHKYHDTDIVTVQVVPSS